MTSSFIPRFVRLSTVCTVFVSALFAEVLLAGTVTAQGMPFHPKVASALASGEPLAEARATFPLPWPSASSSRRLCARANGALVVGLSTQAHWPLVYGTYCAVPLGGAECIPPYPKFNSATALLGWETARGGHGGGLRVLVGPALFRTALKRALRTNGQQTLLGLHGRIDVTAMLAKHSGLLAWAQGSTASPFRNDRYFMAPGGVGFRPTSCGELPVLSQCSADGSTIRKVTRAQRAPAPSTAIRRMRYSSAPRENTDVSLAFARAETWPPPGPEASSVYRPAASRPIVALTMAARFADGTLVQHTFNAVARAVEFLAT